jgi:thiosulfate/3-mercaptopyruvate sulfurtransferase
MTGLPIVVLVLALVAPATGPNEPGCKLVSFDELEKRLGDKDVRVLDARPKPDYDKGHVPGAVWVDAKGVEKLAAKPGALRDRAAWEAWIAPLGIDQDSHVVIYDSRRQLDAARLWWLLRYLGVGHAGLINGGYPLWEKQGRPTSVAVPHVTPRAFNVHFQSNRLAERQDVLAALKNGGIPVIDARTTGEFTGEEKRSKRGGRVPAACHLEWATLVDQDGRFLDEKALREKLANAGVTSGGPVITHCQGGGRASVDAFVFERLGFPTRNYYLGWSDWGNVDDTPIETGAAKRTRP